MEMHLVEQRKTCDIECWVAERADVWSESVSVMLDFSFLFYPPLHLLRLTKATYVMHCGLSGCGECFKKKQLDTAKLRKEREEETANSSEAAAVTMQRPSASQLDDMAAGHRSGPEEKSKV